MPTTESIKKEIHSLGYAQKEEILSYLEEVITFGAVSKEITNNIKESRLNSFFALKNQHRFHTEPIKKDRLFPVLRL